MTFFRAFRNIKSWKSPRNPYKFVFIASALKTKVSGKQSQCQTPYSRFNSVKSQCPWPIKLIRSGNSGNMTNLVSSIVLHGNAFSTCPIYLSGILRNLSPRSFLLITFYCRRPLLWSRRPCFLYLYWKRNHINPKYTGIVCIKHQ